MVLPIPLFLCSYGPEGDGRLYGSGVICTEPIAIQIPMLYLCHRRSRAKQTIPWGYYTVRLLFLYCFPLLIGRCMSSRSVIDVHYRILALGQNTVFNMLTETQQYVSSIVYGQLRPPRIWWSEDYESLTIDGETLHLNLFRPGLDQMFQDMWDILFSITGTKERFANKLLSHFTDNLANTTQWYSWLSHGPFSENRYSLLTHLIKYLNLATVDGASRLSWNLPAIRSFFLKCDLLNDNLA